MPNILRVETYLWDVYKTQNFQFYPKICAKNLWGGNIFQFYSFQFHPENCAKHLGVGNIFLGCVKKTIFSILSQNLCKTFGGWKHISRMCKKPNIFNSIPIFVPQFGGWKHISRMCKRNQHFKFYPEICAQHLGVETYF